MENDFTLVNPSTEDFAEGEKETTTQPQKASKEQLKFDIDTPLVRLRQRINTFKNYLRKRNDIIEISVYWKNPALPFAIVSGAFTVFAFFLIGIFNFNDIPPTIPIMYDFIENRWDSADKSAIFIFPIILLFFESLIIYNNFKIFEHDRRLAMVMSWLTTFLNVLMLIALGQISNLVV